MDIHDSFGLAHHIFMPKLNKILHTISEGYECQQWTKRPTKQVSSFEWTFFHSKEFEIWFCDKFERIERLLFKGGSSAIIPMITLFVNGNRFSWKVLISIGNDILRKMTLFYKEHLKIYRKESLNYEPFIWVIVKHKAFLMRLLISLTCESYDVIDANANWISSYFSWMAI